MKMILEQLLYNYIKMNIKFGNGKKNFFFHLLSPMFLIYLIYLILLYIYIYLFIYFYFFFFFFFFKKK